MSDSRAQIFSLHNKRGALLAPFSCQCLAWLTLRPWRWRQHVPHKLRWTYSGLHGVTPQKIVIFLFVAVRRTSNLANSFFTDSPNAETEERLCAFCRSSKKPPIYLSIKYTVTVVVLVLILFTVWTERRRVFFFFPRNTVKLGFSFREIRYGTYVTRSTNIRNINIGCKISKSFFSTAYLRNIWWEKKGDV
jgi:hypothetical protein